RAAARDIGRRSAFVHYPHEVFDTLDHAAHRGRILQRRSTADRIETQPHQRVPLVLKPSGTRVNLLYRNSLLRGHDQPSLAPCTASSPRRPTISPTCWPRRAATERGEFMD